MRNEYCRGTELNVIVGFAASCKTNLSLENILSSFVVLSFGSTAIYRLEQIHT